MVPPANFHSPGFFHSFPKNGGEGQGEGGFTEEVVCSNIDPLITPEPNYGRYVCSDQIKSLGGKMRSSWIFSQTHQVKGRKRWIDEKNTGLEFLRYGRIVLSSGDAPLSLGTRGEEVGLICLGGQGMVEAQGAKFKMKKFDALYLPIESKATISSSSFFDLVECAAPASKDYGLQFVSFEDVLKNPNLVNQAGFEPYSRTIHTLIGEGNTRAGRILAGVTMSKEGNWTSWPPHDHSEVKEEIYLYVDMPDPHFAVHLNYWDFKKPEIVAMVREGDAVAIKKGYHYNVAAPGTVTTFLWMMAAIREEQDRVFTQVTVQREFERGFKLF
jgi:5-deoxy-glucuronate isomerase